MSFQPMLPGVESLESIRLPFRPVVMNCSSVMGVVVVVRKSLLCVVVSGENAHGQMEEEGWNASPVVV